MKDLQIVTFEQAKKLKELGFGVAERDMPCVNYFYNYYKKSGELIDYGYEESLYDVIPAFETALALKWLRDEKKVFINAEHNPIENKFLYNSSGNILSKRTHFIFKSYEEAESAGLDYALEYLDKIKN